ncbi:hypothetical protein R1sor_001941 [Riccia sorocarpa]|uniref:Uncharacterized protein n=1 Tax=Riccia sorocarpa TaxID=122646 RepID=A0ABD3H1D8_9MARC
MAQIDMEKDQSGITLFLQVCKGKEGGDGKMVDDEDEEEVWTMRKKGSIEEEERRGRGAECRSRSRRGRKGREERSEEDEREREMMRRKRGLEMAASRGSRKGEEEERQDRKRREAPMAQVVDSCSAAPTGPLLSASSSHRHPVSPRTPLICEEGIMDSKTDECCCATSPLSSPFVGVEERERSSREYDAAMTIIERMDDGWFRGNVISCRWGHRSPSATKVREGPVAASAARDRLVEDSASSQGMLSPESMRLMSASQRDLTQPPPYRSIEMVPPLVISRSLSGERDARESRDLPRTRLRRLSRRPGSMDDADARFYPSEQQGSRASVEDTLRLFGQLRIEPSRFGPVMRSRMPEETNVTSRPLSDGDERTDELKAPLSDVREEGESASEDKLPPKVLRRLRLPGKLTPVEIGRESRNPLTDRNGGPATTSRARRRKDKKPRSKSSTDADFDEMRGWNDLGFKINEDDLTPRPLPGLKEAFRGGDDLFDSPRGMASPQGCPRRPDSPVFKWPIPAPNSSNGDMREYLKQWTHSVVSMVVSAES